MKTFKNLSCDSKSVVSFPTAPKTPYPTQWFLLSCFWAAKSVVVGGDVSPLMPWQISLSRIEQLEEQAVERLPCAIANKGDFALN